MQKALVDDRDSEEEDILKEDNRDKKEKVAINAVLADDIELLERKEEEEDEGDRQVFNINET